MPYLAFNLNNGNEFVFDLVEEKLSLGRSTRNDIVIDNSFVSNFHAELVRQADGNYEVADLNSTGGTFVNGERGERFVLKPGDKVRFGPLHARYDFGASASGGRGGEGSAVSQKAKMRQEGNREDSNSEVATSTDRESLAGATPAATSLVEGLPKSAPGTLVAKAPELAAAMEAGLAEHRERFEKNEPDGGKNDPGAAGADDLRIRLIPADVAQLQRAKTELAAARSDLENSKRELESLRQQLSEHKSTRDSASQSFPKEPRATEESLASLGQELKQVEEKLAAAHGDQERRSSALGRLITLTVMANLLALAAAIFWVKHHVPERIEIRYAGNKFTGPAEPTDENESPAPVTELGGPSVVEPVPVDDVSVQAEVVRAALSAPATPTPHPLGEDITPSQRELLLLKERNRLTAYADEAIATGVRASYDRLWEAYHDPRLANLVHAARSEILRVHNAYLGGSRIDRFDIPVGAYFPGDTGLTDSQLKDAQLIKLLSEPTNPWEVRMKAANLLGTRKSVEVGDALVRAVKSDANLDVVKEATFSFDQMTGFHCQIFDAVTLEKWWKEHKARPRSADPKPESAAAGASAPAVSNAGR